MALSTGGETSVQRHDLGELYQQLSELDRSDTHLNRQLGHLFRERRLIWSGDAVHDIVSLESLDAQCETLFNSQELNRSYRETLRKDINVCSRPRLRALTILDMPDEILVRVCEYLDVEGSIDILRYGSAFTRSPSDIKNLRLTCRRFCNTSSHLLLPFVRVELNDASVEHLNTISRHPTISKGVRTVRVALDYYDDELANDFALFAEYVAAKMADHAEFLELMDRAEFKDKELFKALEGNSKKTIQKTRQLEDFCRSCASGVVDEADFGANPSHRNLLQRAHEAYRSCVADQKQVCENGAFFRTVAAAIDQMPRARRLELRERDGESARPKNRAPIRAGEDLYFLFWVVRPMTWGEGRLWALGTPHIDLLGFPGAFHEAGPYLESLNINITSPPKSQDALTAEEMRRLSLSVQQLKYIEIKLLGYEMEKFTDLGHAFDTTELQYLRNYVDAVLNTDSIERLSLDFSCFSSEATGPLTDLGSLMTFRGWENLVDVSWSSVPLYQKDLERFFRQLRKPLKYLRLSCVHLLSGSWVETLEILRTVPAGYKVELTRPRGAECEELSEEEMDRIFRSRSGGDWGKSPAEDYIIGHSKHNPLKAEESDQSDTSSTP